MASLLEVKNLRKQFSDTLVLKDITVTVEEGEFLVIMGQSGSGKSTLLYQISGMDVPTSGELLFENKKLTKLDDKALSQLRLEKMGFIFQKSHLLKNLSIRDNIILPGFKANLLPRKEVVAHAEELMAKTGILKVAEHDITMVSGGQLQRAAICRALINHPKIIFGDEPTGALNSAASNEVMTILKDINQVGTTLVLVTHDPKVAAQASRVIFLADGQITNQIRLDELPTDYSDQREKMMIDWLSQQSF
ncbi:ABC transporter ATP-binding protein [Streptococcus sp. CSL10205-OR2]|uniref:ABC transporter ATP-binding protein n=1 Tax=Streptococcus sp. CSL10205-OR2 TaxID=2980558 RepID=UPI0021D83060|nr:ABC transporter ATP-binding protein [Streptococcus sp. CSL10205-OR2]MCU9533265.1 ABC transporter ATP-binding protein [Streptococcus sp. CSL10205-OR2]